MGGSFHLPSGWIPHPKDIRTFVANQVALLATFIELLTLFLRYIYLGDAADDLHVAEVWLFACPCLVWCHALKAGGGTPILLIHFGMK